MRTILVIASLLALWSCGPQRADETQQNSRNAILKTERDFADMVASRGVAEAFAFYADDSAVIERRVGLIHGKEAIRNHYMDWPYTQVVLKWKPDFVEVSASGDLGYTYGNYFFTGIDSAGRVIKDSGVFHTVWKRQKDGTWRYVWD
jgi:ketosteroid isomerase-like protein